MLMSWLKLWVMTAAVVLVLAVLPLIGLVKFLYGQERPMAKIKLYGSVPDAGDWKRWRATTLLVFRSLDSTIVDFPIDPRPFIFFRLELGMFLRFPPI